MTTPAVLLFLLLHAALCAALYLLWRRGRIRAPGGALFMAVLLPGIGISAVLLADHYARRGDTARAVGVERMVLKDAAQRSFSQTQDAELATLVPVQDALELDDAGTKRSLIMDVLYQDTSQFVDLLKRAGTNEDTEVSHYATTALVELQKTHETELQELARQYRTHGSDLVLLDRHIAALQKYLGLGLLEGSLLTVYRQTCYELLSRRQELAGPSLETSLALFELCLAMRSLALARDTLDLMAEHWPDEASVWLAHLRYASETHDTAAVKSICQEMRHRSIYLTEKDRQLVEFWENET